jgi:hypothetical protein
MTDYMGRKSLQIVYNILLESLINREIFAAAQAAVEE